MVGSFPTIHSLQKFIFTTVFSLFVTLLILSTPASVNAATLFTDPFNGSGDLASYDAHYQVWQGQIFVDTDHAYTGNGVGAFTIYNNISSDNNCTSIDFRSDGWVGLLVRSFPNFGADGVQGDRIDILDGHSWRYFHNSGYEGITVSEGPMGDLAFDRFSPQVRTLKACANGSTLTAYIDNNQFFTAQTANLGGYSGFGAYEPTSYLDNFTIAEVQAPDPQLSSLTPAKVWMTNGLGDIGLKLDVLAEVYTDNSLVSSGQLNSVSLGNGLFKHAELLTIPFASFSPVSIPQGSGLTFKLSARNACSGSSRNHGSAKVWFNNSTANSQLGTVIDSLTTNYYLLQNSLLATTVGTGPTTSSTVDAGTQCSAFKTLGTWTTTL